MPLEKLRGFVEEATATLEQESEEPAILARLQPALAALVAEDDWLPEAFTRPHPEFYQQYLLHCDPRERFSLVSFVWGPGQKTPVHDHTVWGLIGMLRGSEVSTPYLAKPGGGLVEGDSTILNPGDVEAVSPAIGDVHRVRNAHSDQVSISVHIYGANIGKVKRHVFDPETGQAKDFVSGFSNDVLPNIWA